MPVSFAEPLDLDCPSCGARFRAEVWLIVDAAERPDLVARIVDTTIHDAGCPQCAQRGQVPAPLLFHHGPAQRVLLAVPPGMPEDEWREAGQGLLWTLIGALPENRRDPYLGELQAEAGLEGLALVLRSEELDARIEEEPDDALPPIVTAIQALLGANGPAELQQALQRHAILLDPQAVMILRELANEAFKQGEDEAGTGFSRAADILNEVRATSPDTVLRAPADHPASHAGTQPIRAEDPLDTVAFALLRSVTGEMLAETVEQYPELFDAGYDAALASWAERARAHGKPRIADGMDDRRASLRLIREQYESERPVFDALQALLHAETVEELEMALVEHDALFTDSAEQMLQRLVDAADPELVDLIRERQALLRRVRAALEAQAHDEQGAP